MTENCNMKKMSLPLLHKWRSLLVKYHIIRVISIIHIIASLLLQILAVACLLTIGIRIGVKGWKRVRNGDLIVLPFLSVLGVLEVIISVGLLLWILKQFQRKR